MGGTSDVIFLPAKIHDYLEMQIRRRWVGEGRDPHAVVEALPESLSAGHVTRLVSGGPFGWIIDARLDEIEGRVALEVLEDDRMSGPDHYRIWEDGSRDQLETETTAFVLPPNPTPDEARRIEDSYYSHNRKVQSLLKQRGFRSAGD
jgi:hypothetical protein